jgi:hypothetical protein
MKRSRTTGRAFAVFPNVDDNRPSPDLTISVPGYPLFANIRHLLIDQAGTRWSIIIELISLYVVSSQPMAEHQNDTDRVGKVHYG